MKFKSDLENLNCPILTFCANEQPYIPTFRHIFEWAGARGRGVGESGLKKNTQLNLRLSYPLFLKSEIPV